MIVRRPPRLSPSAGLEGGARPHTRWVPSRSLAAGCGVAVAAGSLAVLTGWAFGIARLKNLSPGAVSTKPTAAVALALCGVALALSATEPAGARVRTMIAMGGAGLAAAFGVVTLLEYATGADLGIDQLLFHETAHSAGTSSPGRMALMTALALMLAACSLVLVRGRAMAQQVLAGGVTGHRAERRARLSLRSRSRQAMGNDRGRRLYGGDAGRRSGSGCWRSRSESGFVGALFADTPGGLTARSLLLTR